MHRARSNKIVASILDVEPAPESLTLILPGFSCGPFTLQRPICFQISGPTSSPPAAVSATSPSRLDGRSGQFYNGLRPSKANPQAYDETARERLRVLSVQLTGLA